MLRLARFRSSCLALILLWALAVLNFGCAPKVPSWVLNPIDQSSEFLLVRGPVRDISVEVDVNSVALIQTKAQDFSLDWTFSGNTPVLGHLSDGTHQTWTGDFDGSGQTQVLLYDRSAHSWSLGSFDAAKRIRWRQAGNTVGFGDLMDNAHQVWIGNFDAKRPSQVQVLFYYNVDGNWWLGQTDGGPLTWAKVGNTTGFGNVIDSAHRVWIGSFSASGRAQVLFHYNVDGNWWLGEMENDKIGWAKVGSSKGFGNLFDAAHAVWTGAFAADGRTQLMFHYIVDGRWWYGSIDASKKLAWSEVAETKGFGNILDGAHRFWTGAFTAPGQTSLLFYSKSDSNWRLGTLNPSTLRLAWNDVGNTAGFGDLLDKEHRVWTGAFGGSTDEVLFHFSGDSNWWSGIFRNGKLSWEIPGNTRGFGDLLIGEHQFWTGRFGRTGRTDMLFYHRQDGNWWLGSVDGARVPLPRALEPGEKVAVKSLGEGHEISNSLAVSHDYATQHYDRPRTGWNPRETTLSPATAPGLKIVAKLATDDQVYAQPLYAQGVAFAGQSAPVNVVYLVSERGTVYAFDADSGAALAHRSLMRAGETSVPAIDAYGPDNINILPVISVTGTPVIDRPTGSLYVVVKSKDSAGQYHHRVHHLGIEDLGEKPDTQAEIRPQYQGTPFSQLANDQRPGLLLSRGTLYVGFGSHADLNDYHGWVIGFDAKTMSQQTAFTASKSSGAGIWQSGQGLAADPEGNVLFSTGNWKIRPSDVLCGSEFATNMPFNPATATQGWTNSVLKLDRGLKLVDWFTPYTQFFLDCMDWDLGSGGVLVVPDQPAPARKMVIAAGKQGFIYLLDRNGLGHYTQKGPDAVLDVQELYPGHVSTSKGKPAGSDKQQLGMFGGPAYFRGGADQRIYLSGGRGDGAVGQLVSFQLVDAKLTARRQSTRAVGATTPFVTSNGEDLTTAVVWVLERDDPLKLVAFRADKLDAVLLDLKVGPWSMTRVKTGAAFVVPTIIEGRVYVPTAAGVTVLGLHDHVLEVKPPLHR